MRRFSVRKQASIQLSKSLCPRCIRILNVSVARDIVWCSVCGRAWRLAECANITTIYVQGDLYGTS